MNLASVLLAVLFTVHYMPDVIESLYVPEQRTAAGKAWEYILTNAGFAVVLALVGILVRSRLVGWRWYLVSAVCAWGIFESLERVIFRLARPIGGTAPVAETFSGLGGSGWYTLGLCIAAALAAWVAWGARK